MEKERESIKLQYVVTQLAGEEYGIPIIFVESLTLVPEITKVPDMPEFVEGIINLRGKIIPIIDLRKRFGLPEKSWDENTRVVVAVIEGQSIGMLVDGVSDVTLFTSDQIDPIPPAISQVGREYLTGVGKIDEDKRLILLLDIEKVLTHLEKASLKKGIPEEAVEDKEAILKKDEAAEEEEKEVIEESPQEETVKEEAPLTEEETSEKVDL